MQEDAEPEVEVYTDEQGRKVKRYPPAYSSDIRPTALPKSHPEFDE